MSISTSKTDAWTRANDYIKTAYTLSLKNIGSREVIRNQELIEVCEFLPAGLVLKVPRKTIAQGHVLMASIEKKYLNTSSKKVTSTKLAFTGKISECESLNADFDVVTLQFYQFNKVHWDHFLAEYEEKQRLVDAAVAKVQK